MADIPPGPGHVAPPPFAVSGLHLASLPHGGFACSDYPHLTTLRREVTAAAALAATYISSLEHVRNH